ncbi:MAG: hypothetical protein PHE17_07135 [Thiothrix sp.]|uniref:DUF7684 family protein n=1 Tax=Thiothrix sp. TaxID=1032 RepID=UPI0026381C8E|nr:hypothetical protein [Thiothrix sp.]MDD5392777.1 hypothetical protein [Thiothrix sp.]
MQYPGKVILVSTSAYQPERDAALLHELLQSKIELFCAVGADARSWEDALDWLLVTDYWDDSYSLITTAHPDESLEEVIEFAQSFHTSSGKAHEPEVLYRK